MTDHERQPSDQAPVSGANQIDDPHEIISPDALSPTELDQVADHQLLHAILKQWFEDKNASEIQVTKTMTRLRQDEEPAPAIAGRIGPRWRLLPWSIAAAVLIVCGVWLVTDSNRPAIAALEAALQADRDLLDRRYVMTLEYPMPHPAGPETIVHLYLRDNKYVARFLSHRGHPIVVGDNGQQSWMVLPDGQPVYREKGNPLEELLMENSDVSIPFLSVESVLSRLRDHYSLRAIGPQQLSMDDRVSWQYLVGTRSSGSGPDRIEMWSHPETGVAQKLTLQWDESAQPRQPQKITFQRIDGNAQEDVFYEAESHVHDGVTRNYRGHPPRDPGEMIDRLLKRDTNGDGSLNGQELGPNGARLLHRYDANRDGMLDQEELQNVQPQRGDYWRENNNWRNDTQREESDEKTPPTPDNVDDQPSGTEDP